jgi:hypothetical protein
MNWTQKFSAAYSSTHEKTLQPSPKNLMFPETLFGTISETWKKLGLSQAHPAGKLQKTWIRLFSVSFAEHGAFTGGLRVQVPCRR